MSEDTIFDRARAAHSVGGLLSVADGARWRRLKRCPLCEGRDDFSYTASAWRCWKCGEHGDVIDLGARLWSMSRIEAAREMTGERDAPKQDAPRPARKAPIVRAPARPAPDARKRDAIADILAGSRPARGTPVETYLASRGIDPRKVDATLDSLLYNPAAIHGVGQRLPAMVARVSEGGRDTGGVHCTYLRADGRGKTELSPAKKMWGAQKDDYGRPGGIVLVPCDPTALLIVAEGIENALSALAMQDDSGAGAFAAGSLDRLQGGMGVGVWGGVDWRKPRPDPTRPAATLRHRGPVLVVVDSDMAPLRIQPETKWAKTIAAERRAQVSAMLAASWWRQAGASEVRVFAPPPGMDANDVLRGAEAEKRCGGAAPQETESTA